MTRGEFISVAAFGGTPLRALAGRTSQPQSVQTRDFRLLTLPGGKTAVPRWHYGLLVFLHFPGDGAPHFTVADPEADRIVARVTVEVPEAREVFPVDLAVFPDRKRFAISAVSRNLNGTRSLWLLFYSAEGQRLHAEKVTPFQPRILAAAPDNTVWAVGANVRTVDNRNSTDAVLCRWNDRGQLLHQALERRLFPEDVFPGEAEPDYGTPALAVSPDRAAVYMPASGVLAEVSMAGEILGVHRPPRPADPGGKPARFHGLALLDGGEIFGAMGGIRRFDRATGSWSAPESSPALAQGRIVYGSFGRQLLINGASGDRFHYRLVVFS
jgi:hypothetical protein